VPAGLPTAKVRGTSSEPSSERFLLKTEVYPPLEQVVANVAQFAQQVLSTDSVGIRGRVSLRRV
jgi:hypothetical protein